MIQLVEEMGNEAHLSQQNFSEMFDACCRIDSDHHGTHFDQKCAEDDGRAMSVDEEEEHYLDGGDSATIFNKGGRIAGGPDTSFATAHVGSSIRSGSETWNRIH